MVVKSKLAGPAPGIEALREASLRYLSRFAATEAGVVRILDRRVQRWARTALAEGQDVVSEVVAARAAVRQVGRWLVETGMVNDALFASARAARLVRSGKSRKAVAAHLCEKGVAQETAQAVLPGPDREILAALAYARRRRLGPFKGMDGRVLEADDQAVWGRELGALARAGFSRDVAERALQMPALEAEELLLASRRA